MYRKSRFRFAFLLMTVVTFMILMVSPLYSQEGNGRGNGNRGQDQGEQHVPPGQAKKQEDAPPVQDPPAQPEQEPQEAMSVPEQEQTLLGCQKNNPDRLDCSSLEVTGYCDGSTAVFVVTNTGEAGEGDMVAATFYQIVQNGTTVQSGTVQIGGGQSTEIRYDGAGDITFMVDQQVGHPGNSHPRVTLNCGGPVEEPTFTPTDEPTFTPTDEPTFTPTDEPTFTPTDEPTFTPTDEPTPTPTDEETPPDLIADPYCSENGSANFSISNLGGAMTEAMYYTITDGSENVIAAGWLMLDAGETYVVTLEPTVGPVTLNIENAMISATIECYAATEEVTPEPVLLAFSSCDASGAVIFEIINFGGDMAEPVYYSVIDANNNIIGEGWVQLVANDVLLINMGFQSGPVTLVVGDWITSSVGECVAMTEEPTPEPTSTPTDEPTATPTDEPTATPTDEPTPTPTDEPTATPTDEPTITPTVEVPSGGNCQKNNPDRLDCSSLEVTGYCDGSTAVFVITNGGEPGEGNMSQPTEYRLIQDGVVIESGSVQIAGGETMEVRYDGGGRITLEADQQIGHPGKSQPQTTLTCGG